MLGRIPLRCKAYAVWLAVVWAMLTVFPGAPVWGTLGAGLVLTVLAVRVYSMTRAATRVGCLLLIAASAVLTAGLVANVWWFTTASGGTDGAPVLVNVDAARNWKMALDWYHWDGRGDVPHYYGLPWGVTMLVFGPSITALTFVSVASTLGTLVLTAVSARALGCSRKTATMALAAVTAVCYVMASGMIVVKDAWMCCATAAAGCALAMLSGPRRYKTASVLGIGLAGCVLIAVQRPNYLAMPVMGAVLTAFTARRRGLMPRLVLVVACVVLWVLMDRVFGNFDPEAQLFRSDNGGLSFGQQQTPYFSLFGEINLLPWWQRLLYMPVAAGVQFTVPFWWTWQRDMVFGPSQAYAHFGFTWYAVGALIAYGVWHWRRVPRAVLGYAVWGIAVWMVPVFMYAGAISRYGLPAVSLMAPLAGYVCVHAWRRRGLWVWLGVFGVLMAGVLGVCYRLTH